MLIALAFQLSVAVQAPDTATLNQPAEIRYRATAPGNTPPSIALPSVPGAVLAIRDDRIRIGGGFGTAVATRELLVQLVPTQLGRLVLAPARAFLGGEVAVSPSRTLFVRRPPLNAVPGIVSRAPVTGQEGIEIHAITTPDSVWAGEQLTLQVGVFLDDAARTRLARNPDYAPPEIADAIAVELPVSADRLPAIDRPPRRYRPYVFARALFALQTGSITIPPAQLTIAESDGAGSVVERTLSSAPRRVVVRELPAAGRPASFAGAVGIWTVTARVDSVASAREDGAQLEVVVSGVGNPKLLPAPQVVVRGGTASVVRELVQVDSSDLLVRGSKTFRIAVSPDDREAPEVLAVAYSWFNPATGTYETATLPLSARPLAAADTATTVAASAVTAPQRAAEIPTWRWLGIDIWRWPAAVVGTMLLLASVLTVGRRRAARAALPVPRREGARTARLLRREFIDTLTAIAPSGAVIDASSLPDMLRRAGASPTLAAEATAVLRSLDALVFVEDGAVDAALDGEVARVTRDLTVGTVRRRTPALGRAIRASLLVGILSPMCLAGAQSPRNASAVAQQVVQAPDDAAAWAALADAQRARGDSAGAVVAARISGMIQPWRNPAINILSTAAAGASWRTRLPLMPPILALLLASLVMAGGLAYVWHALGTGLSRRTAALAVSALWSAALVPMVVIAYASLAPDLAMARDAVTLRRDPALAGESLGRLRPGEIVIVLAKSDRWWQVRSPDRRDGWVPAGPVRSLARRDRARVAQVEAELAAGEPLR
jgi:ABC-type amino acid transport substrate-binding protein